jgi:hypothetical protein
MDDARDGDRTFFKVIGATGGVAFVAHGMNPGGTERIPSVRAARPCGWPRISNSSRRSAAFANPRGDWTGYAVKAKDTFGREYKVSARLFEPRRRPWKLGKEAIADAQHWRLPYPYLYLRNDAADAGRRW